MALCGCLCGNANLGVVGSGDGFLGVSTTFGHLVCAGVWLLLPVANRALSAKSAKKALGVVTAAVLAVLGYSIFNDPQEINGTITRVQPEPATPVAGVAEGDWPAYGRTQEGTRYSPLTQINKDNVKNLQVAWTYHTEDFKTDADSGEGTYEVTPLKENDTLYLCTTHQFLDAVDAATGKRLWRFDPHLAPTKTLPAYDLPRRVLL